MDALMEAEQWFALSRSGFGAFLLEWLRRKREELRDAYSGIPPAAPDVGHQLVMYQAQEFLVQELIARLENAGQFLEQARKAMEESDEQGNRNRQAH